MHTIMLVDDHEVVRQGLRVLLDAEPDLSVVAEATDGIAAVETAVQVKPDIVVMDVMLPGLNGIEATRQIAKRVPGSRVVVLSMYTDESYVLRALKNGAYGYVLKSASVGDLIRAIREALAGRRYLSPPLSDGAIRAYQERASAQSDDALDELTDRERQVLQLAAEGRTNRDIAQRLGISFRTVETHRTNLGRKLGLRTYTELVQFAVRRGLIPNVG